MLKTDEPSGKILFEEEQKYPRWIMWLIGTSMFLAVAGMLLALIMEKEKTDILIGLAVTIPTTVLAIFLNSNMRFEKTVTSNGLYYRWRPWQKRFRVIEKDDIETVSGRKFPFLNYGFGWFPTYGWYYNVSGREGLQLYLKNGGRLFFSSYDTSSFERALQNLISGNPKTRMSEF
jgi:hypothetical protein